MAIIVREFNKGLNNMNNSSQLNQLSEEKERYQSVLLNPLIRIFPDHISFKDASAILLQDFEDYTTSPKDWSDWQKLPTHYLSAKDSFFILLKELFNYQAKLKKYSGKNSDSCEKAIELARERAEEEGKPELIALVSALTGLLYFEMAMAETYNLPMQRKLMTLSLSQWQQPQCFFRSNPKTFELFVVYEALAQVGLGRMEKAMNLFYHLGKSEYRPETWTWVLSRCYSAVGLDRVSRFYQRRAASGIKLISNLAA
jgi:hypothetical protein